MHVLSAKGKSGLFIGQLKQIDFTNVLILKSPL